MLTKKIIIIQKNYIEAKNWKWIEYLMCKPSLKVCILNHHSNSELSVNLSIWPSVLPHLSIHLLSADTHLLSPPSVLSCVTYSTCVLGILRTPNAWCSWWRSCSSSITSTSASGSGKALVCSLSTTACWMSQGMDAAWRSTLDAKTAGYAHCLCVSMDTYRETVFTTVIYTHAEANRLRLFIGSIYSYPSQFGLGSQEMEQVHT